MKPIKFSESPADHGGGCWLFESHVRGHVALFTDGKFIRLDKPMARRLAKALLKFADGQAGGKTKGKRT